LAFLIPSKIANAPSFKGLQESISPHFNAICFNDLLVFNVHFPHFSGSESSVIAFETACENIVACSHFGSNEAGTAQSLVCGDFNEYFDPTLIDHRHVGPAILGCGRR
jgi:hypothetical protein